MKDEKYTKKPGSKWEGLEKGTNNSASSNSGNVGNSYTPQYAKRSSPRYSPKKAVKSFRDLEVYQKPMECSVLICSELIPILVKDKFPLVEGLRDCALSIPLRVAEAHGMRFSDFGKAVATLELAMQGCNKMIVYLEQAGGLSHNADKDFIEDLSKRYMNTRGKMLRLERSWQKFRVHPD